MVTVKETLKTLLKVREGPGASYSVISAVSPGESYPLLEEAEGWYKIEFEEGKTGWILGLYADKTISE
jgi:uncharacterized protein YgiM (DUF1202 family)